jgi:hypothetical protein
MTTEPLIEALVSASESSARVAGNLARDGYTARYENGCPDDLLADAYIADALTSDHFGVAPQNDRRTMDDRNATVKARHDARARYDWRVEVAVSLSNLTPEMRRETYDAIARKGGAAFARRLQDAADALLIATADQAIAEVAASQKVAA